jgi:hypothetical protein
MSEPSLSAANRAARKLSASLKAPRGALSVMAWMQSGKISLVVMVDPRYAGQLDIPDYFEGFRVDIRSKKPIRATN